MDRRTGSFEACPRYDKHELSDDQIIDIAKRAVQLARDEFYHDIGKSITQKFFWAIGVIVVGSLAWFSANGYLK